MLRQPSTVRIRVGLPADAADLAIVCRESWRLAYAGLLPETHLARLIATRTPAWWAGAARSSGGIVALDVGGKLAGYATCGRARNRSRYQGEIFELYLAPTYQGLGFGEHLFEACRARLDRKGLNGLLVWALTDNAHACQFYWSRGGRPVATAMETFDRQRIAKTAFGWP